MFSIEVGLGEIVGMSENIKSRQQSTTGFKVPNHISTCIKAA
jgi:hypothetical protein